VAIYSAARAVSPSWAHSPANSSARSSAARHFRRPGHTPASRPGAGPGGGGDSEFSCAPFQVIAVGESKDGARSFSG